MLTIENSSLKDVNDLVKKYVKVKTYLSTRPLYGEILESTENTITLVPQYIGSFDKVNYDKLQTYLLPKNSIINIEVL